MSDFDPKRALLRGPDVFPRFTVPDGPHPPLRDQDVDPDAELMIVAPPGVDARLGFLVREIAHPHGCQGTLRGTPYLVSF